MTEASLTTSPAANLQPAPPSNSILRHAVYVIADNPVTGLSFGLFTLIALCAVIGPYVVPYDPLASDTSATLQSPSSNGRSAVKNGWRLSSAPFSPSANCSRTERSVCAIVSCPWSGPTHSAPGCAA